MAKYCVTCAVAFVLSGAASAAPPLSPTSTAAPLPVTALSAVSPANQTVLPANTEVLLRMNDALTSKNAREGDMFGLSLVHDVILDGYIVIPRGTRAVGQITWRTGKGMLGKSGKMDIELRYIDLNGRRIPLEGKFRQEGDGNTVATATSVVLLWPVAPIITGKSATIPQGRELMARTTEALPVALPGPPLSSATVAGQVAPTVTPIAATAPAQAR